MQLEVWKAVPGYEPYYEVSNLGRVKSLCKRGGCHGLVIEAQREKIMTPTDNGNGYLIVSLRNPSGRKNKYVHRLVAQCFVDNPCGHSYVNHLDYDTKNNAAANLEWCSAKENIVYSVEHMKHAKSKYKVSNTGEKYIYLCRNGKYRVTITGHSPAYFRELGEAISYRNGVMRDDEYYAER